ncbi:hypothetical protein UlMin_018609 [Ulmus minor]
MVRFELRRCWNKRDWIRLWSSLLLPGHKLIWWLGLVYALLSRNRLARLFSIADLACPLCGFQEESLVHLFFQCMFAAQFWLTSPWNLNSSAASFISLFDWCRKLWRVEDLIEDKDKLLRFIACVMDVVWRARNEVLHGTMILSFGEFSLWKRQLFSLSCSSLRPNLLRLSLSWVALLEGWVKVNFDAAVSPSCSMATMVARDYDGAVLAWNTKLLSPSTALMAKANACLMAVELAIARGWKFCIFEGDAKVVIDACIFSNTIPWEISHLVVDILSYSSLFLAWDFAFVSIMANVAAHCFATKAGSH